jgi:hypothetical protein
MRADETRRDDEPLRWLLMVSAAAEGLTGAALFVAPGLVTRLLLGGELARPGSEVARICALAFVSLAVACWPGPQGSERTPFALRGLLPYNAGVAAYLGYLWARGFAFGVLLIPATVYHVVMAAALAGIGLGHRGHAERSGRTARWRRDRTPASS